MEDSKLVYSFPFLHNKFFSLAILRRLNVIYGEKYYAGRWMIYFLGRQDSESKRILERT